MIRFRLITAVVTVTLICLPMLVGAQEGPEMLSWAGTVKVKPGMGVQFEKAFDTYTKPLLDQLVADGKASSWAIGYELAGPGGYDYVFWVTAPGWAGIGEVEAAFLTRYEGMSEEDLAAMIEAWTATEEPDSGQTLLLRHSVYNGNPDADWNFLRLSHYTVKPGHGGDLMKMYESFAVPVYEQLLEAGVISGYGMAEQAVHSDNSFTHEAWITFDSLSDLDAVEQAFDNAYEEHSEGVSFARRIAFMKLVEPEAHFDRLIRVWMKSE